ncbi:MAG: LysM peptidoglycan-binding domain-containing protein [Pseudomonadota bacterium]
MFARIVVLVLVAVVAWAAFARPSTGAGPERGYVVRPSDTLWSIAQSHYPGDPRAAVWKLRARNGLDDATLVPGQRLVLPSA